MKKLLNVNEILDILGIHENTLYKLCQRDETFPVRKIAGRYKADPDELEAWYKAQPTFIQEHEQKLMQIAKRPGRTPISVTKTLQKMAR